MDALSGDLMKPLGIDAPQSATWRGKTPLARVLAAVLTAALGAVSLYVTLADDPFGGEPYALVPIERGTGGADQPRPPEPAPPAEAAPRVELRSQATATEVEAKSGVAVVRPDGAGAPSSVIIQVPDTPAGKLKPAPDPRLIERTRFGMLPKIGPDGARPAKVYARPPGAMAGGARPAARVALVVAGLGMGQTATAEALAKLPAPVTLAFTPYGGDLERSVAQAREDGHEVLLQVPMEPFDYPDNDPGPHTLTVAGRGQENIARLHWLMARATGYVGLVGHMGARVTSDEAVLAPILREIGARGLVFVDDGASARSLVGAVGATVETPTVRADLVLDGVARPDAIDKQLQRLEQIARQRGFALGSASALPATVERIGQWAKALESRGVLLVPVSNAFAQEEGR